MTSRGEESKTVKRRRSAIFAFRSAAAAKLCRGTLTAIGEDASCIYAMYSWCMTLPKVDPPPSDVNP